VTFCPSALFSREEAALVRRHVGREAADGVGGHGDKDRVQEVALPQVGDQMKLVITRLHPLFNPAVIQEQGLRLLPQPIPLGWQRLRSQANAGNIRIFITLAAWAFQ
jgi:hypothetical protein